MCNYNIDYSDCIDEIVNLLNGHYKYVVNSLLTDEMRYIISGYSDGGSMVLKRFMLKQQSFNSNTKETLKDDVQHLRKAINLSKIPYPLKLYHGTDNAMFSNVDRLKRGDTLKTNTFLSTSLCKDVACDFMGHPPVMLEINIPSNYPALWVCPLSVNKPEEEVLLLDNTEFYVRDYNQNNIKKYINIKVAPKRR